MRPSFKKKVHVGGWICSRETAEGAVSSDLSAPQNVLPYKHICVYHCTSTCVTDIRVDPFWLQCCPLWHAAQVSTWEQSLAPSKTLFFTHWSTFCLKNRQNGGGTLRRQVDHCELKASLIDIVSSWPERVTKRDCDLKTKINTRVA